MHYDLQFTHYVALIENTALAVESKSEEWGRLSAFGLSLIGDYFNALSYV